VDYSMRQGTPADAEALVEIRAAAFDISPDNPRYPQMVNMAERAPQAFRVMERGGEIIALLHIGDDWLQVGKCAVLKGDVGHVSVRPDLQGQGIGSTLMRETMEWMRENGYHLSRLGGLLKFYRRFGYEPFPRRFVEFYLDEIQTEAGMVPAAEAIAEPSGYEGVIRPYNEATDWKARAEVRYAFDNGRSGAYRVTMEATEPTSPAPPDPDGLQFVYEVDGRVNGILFAAEAPLESSETETCFNVGDFGYLPACPEAGGLLFQQLLARVVHRAPVRIITRLPFDEQVASDLTQAGVAFHRIEMFQAPGGNMIQVLNLAGILEEIAPELRARLAASLVPDWAGIVEFSLPGQAAQLAVGEGRVEVIQGDTATVTLESTQAELTKALFGIAGLDELPCVRSASLDARTRELLRALFPRCPAGSGPWG